jgi:hypothetical protein
MNSRFENGRVISAVRPLLYPALSLSASMKLSAALAEWEKERFRAMVISLGFAALVGALGGALAMAMRQREKVEAELGGAPLYALFTAGELLAL